VPLGDRGPQGVWTLQRAGAPLPPAQCSFAAAKPSLTHQARLLADGSGNLAAGAASPASPAKRAAP